MARNVYGLDLGSYEIKIYDKMKELEDSLYGMDYSIFAK